MSDANQSTVEVLSDAPARIYPRGGSGTGLAMRLLFGLLLVLGVGMISIGGYIGYTRLQNEYSDYTAMKAVLIYNIQQQRLLVLPAASQTAPVLPQAPPPAASGKPAETPKK